MKPVDSLKKQQIVQMYRQIDELDLLLTQYFTDLNDFNLTYQQEQILLLFKRQKTWTTTEIALRMNISKSAVSQVLKVLQQETFIRKEKNPENLRESFIHLDVQGVAYSKKIDEIEDRLTEELFSLFAEDDLNTVTKAFNLMINYLKK
ncbi:MarR family winged helix-turn-helix transcriptional regulator [Metabacillus sp. JX24]|uniref:MarR family winged helix-turn-helix transcriptional regulator n=1 Tax=Metabacillus sp. JX24 TaxID=3240759 RepID=UPI00350FDE0B